MQPAVPYFCPMHYVSAEGLTKAYGIKPLFEKLSFHISEGDKIAIVARNGAGKSTLLKIVAGLETPDEGKIWIHKDVDVAFLSKNQNCRKPAPCWMLSSTTGIRLWTL